MEPKKWWNQTMEWGVGKNPRTIGVHRALNMVK